MTGLSLAPRLSLSKVIDGSRCQPCSASLVRQELHGGVIGLPQVARFKMFLLIF
jgi:hypothetical protein